MNQLHFTTLTQCEDHIFFSRNFPVISDHHHHHYRHRGCQNKIQTKVYIYTVGIYTNTLVRN